MVTIDENNIKSFLKFLGFELVNGEINQYFKSYNKYEIVIEIKSNFKTSTINYGDKIKTDRKTTCNFSQQENFVILECVNRLLEKGYSPDKIILEKDWKLGHKEKGNLDIQILDDTNRSFMMIECKAFGKEFEKEEKKMYENGGQLFSYYIQDKETKYLCLYSSEFQNDTIELKYKVIKITSEIKSSSNQQEAYENWTPQVFEKRGLFEDNIKPYLIKFSGLIKNDLNPITAKDGSVIFNRFEEILRKNVISDKTNAYNKIFNLFLCKIVDEYERNDEERLKFQWEEGETNISVLLRLNELYKRGMEHYLNINISSVDIEEFTNKLKYLKNDSDKEELKNLFIRQKLYTSNDFAFKEVFDEETFNSNCIVVKEVVKLIEEFKIKYETKQHFLGDFFENLLNTGIKQEEGQYFTPVPIAQFICKCLPISKIIEEKNNNSEINILPYVIDYSSGAGHFLTEVMEEINNKIKLLEDNFFKNQKAKKEFNLYKNDFDWAKEYVYGIEKDYRLAKTTKVATYLNGDGDAQIICGDGLDNFYLSRDYKGILKCINNNNNNKDLEKFDIIVANPPYTVNGFKSTVKYGKESFELFEDFTDKSDEIECLFMERTKQLLRVGGVAGIVLPTNIIEGSGIYSKVRKILFENFYIRGIVRLERATFMATNTASIILFIEKKENKKEEIEYYLKKSINEKKDNSIIGIEKPISKYLENTHKIKFEEYFEKPFDNTEFEKIVYFIMNYKQSLNVFCIPKNNLKEERNILGYKFSSKKGYEGIYVFKKGGMLYNPKEENDKSKLNYYFKQSFYGNVKSNENLNIFSVNLNDIIDYKDNKGNYFISINKFQVKANKVDKNAKKSILKLREQEVIKKLNEIMIDFKSKYEFDKKPVRNFLQEDIQTGATPFTRNYEFWENGDINWLKIGDMDSKYITEVESKITEKGRESKKLRLFPEGTVLFSIFATLGNVAIIKTPTTLNQAICGLIPDKKKISSEYLYYSLLLNREEIASKKLDRTQENLNQTKVSEFEIIVFKDNDVREKLVQTILDFEKSIKL